MNKKLLPYILAIVIAILAGYIDYSNSHAGLSAIIIFVSAFVFGIIYHKNFFLFVFIIGVGIPFFHFSALALGFTEPFPPIPNEFMTFTALIPSLVGGFAGFMIEGIIVPDDPWKS